MSMQPYLLRSPVVRGEDANDLRSFFGRSTGAGAVSIWTHHLKDTEVLPEYESEDYTGPALKVGAGVTGAEAVEAAHASGLAVVSGECPSVGLAGGFTQGGGHSTLSTSFGLAADQVLEYEVVTAKGKILTASPKKNSDLYWALSGGGGGTYAVVTSMTVRAYDTGNVGGAKIQFLANSTDAETYGEIVKRFHSLAPDMVDQGATITYILNGLYFQIGPFTIANCTEERVREITAPLVSALKELEIPFAAEYSSLSFRDHYDKYLGPLPWGSLASSEWQYGGRMLPRSAFTDGKTVVSSVINKLLAAGTVLVGTVGTFTPPHEVSNAVMPAWRDTLVQLQILTPWSTDPAAWPTMLALQDKMTDELIPQIKAVTPDSATYMNEADFQEPDWKNEFFKGTYEKLLKIKKKWDPENLFYILKGVGSDAWEVDNNGKMCRT